MIDIYISGIDSFYLLIYRCREFITLGGGSMKRISMLALCALLSGCLHTAPGEVKSEAPVVAGKQEKPELTAALAEKTIIKGKTTTQEILAALGAPMLVEKNERQLSKELLASVKTKLPPIAYTKQFWKYRAATPINPDRVDGAAEQIKVLNLVIFVDDNDVAVDYLISESVAKLP